MIVDAYCHCGLSKYLPVEDVLQAMDDSHVTHAVLCQHLGEFDNTYLGSVVVGRRDTFAAVALADHTRSDWRTVVTTLAHEKGFSGLRVTSDLLLENPDLAVLAGREGMNVVVDAFRGIAEVATPVRRMAQRVDGAPVIISHLGYPIAEGGDVLEGWEVITELAAEPNVFLQLSGMSMMCGYPYRELNKHLAKGLTAFGSARVLWGSNFPVCGGSPEYRQDLALILDGAWGLTPDDIANITVNTAKQLWFP